MNLPVCDVVEKKLCISFGFHSFLHFVFDVDCVNLAINAWLGKHSFIMLII